MKQAAKGFLAQRSASLVTTVIVAVTIGLTIVSPAVLVWVSSESVANPFRGYDWDLLSSVGESYGAVSAILAGLALVAVAASLVMQARQVRIAQLQAIRSFQLELFRTAYEHPDLQVGWSRSVDVPYPEWRLRTYTNMVFSYMQMGFDMRFMSDASVERMLTNRLRTDEGRRFWEAARAAWRVDAQGRRQRRFVALADRVYEEALRTPALPARPPSGPEPPATEGARATRVPAWGLLWGGLGVAYLLGRRRRRSRGRRG